MFLLLIIDIVILSTLLFLQKMSAGLKYVDMNEYFEYN